MQLDHIPLRKLKISPLNMRHGRKAPELDDILPSIRARGIQQPLLVRASGKGYEIVAGRRRFFAARRLAKEGHDIGPIPCAVMEDADDVAALEASLIENIARLDPDEMSRYETFARLAGQGRTSEEIAATFGLSERGVARVLALGNLLPDIREAYRNEEIDAATIRHLTMASEARQAEWLALFNDSTQRAPRGWQLKQWLFGAQIATGAALFALEDYPGRIVSDLFSEDCYFDDPALFWPLQNRAIAARREALLQDGWAEVAILDPGARFHSWEHISASRKKGGRVYVEVRENGETVFHEGYITAKEHRRRLPKSEGAEEDTPPPAARSELTQAAQNYLGLHRHAAVRHALLGHPGLALRLALAHAVIGSSLWRVEPEPQRAEREEIAESLAASKAQAAFEAERREVLILLGLEADSAHLVQRFGGEDDLLTLFTALLALPDEAVLRAFALLMAETLAAGSLAVEALGLHLKVDMREYWQPDEAFFTLLRDKAAINAMLAEIGGRVTAQGNVSATVKTQKQIIRAYLTGEGREKVEGWLPRYMAFPFQAHTEGGGGWLAAQASRAAALRAPVE
jgi:ParB family chromosome partitioning protein